MSPEQKGQACEADAGVGGVGSSRRAEVRSRARRGVATPWSTSDLTFKREEVGPAQGGQAKQVRVWEELNRGGEEREEREGEDLALHHARTED